MTDDQLHKMQQLPECPFCHITEWPEKEISGGKRVNISCDLEYYDPSGEDLFRGFGKDITCVFEGTWWDMICFARNVLASENTKLAVPEYYHPEMRVEHDTGGEPYTFEEVKE